MTQRAQHFFSASSKQAMITQLMGEEKSISARKVSQFPYLASSFAFFLPSQQ